MVSDDGLSAIAFNGEIYNVRELKRSLEAEGVRFSSDHSDTELVLRLYETRGLDALSELNGMFAFAILDGRRRRLVAARDRFGIKPLYYARLGRPLRARLGAADAAPGPGRRARARPREPVALPDAALRPGRALDPRGRPPAAAGPSARGRPRNGRARREALVPARVRARRRAEPDGVGRAAPRRARRGRRPLEPLRRPDRVLALRRARLERRRRPACAERRGAGDVLARVLRRRRRASPGAGARRPLRNRSPRDRGRSRTSCCATCSRWCGRSTSPTAADCRPGTCSASWRRT